MNERLPTSAAIVEKLPLLTAICFYPAHNVHTETAACAASVTDDADGMSQFRARQQQQNPIATRVQWSFLSETALVISLQNIPFELEESLMKTIRFIA
jgi:hypothetical protein